MPIVELETLKKKYPQYQGIDDATLVNALVKKYPVYAPLRDKVAATLTPERRGQMAAEAQKKLAVSQDIANHPVASALPRVAGSMARGAVEGTKRQITGARRFFDPNVPTYQEPRSDVDYSQKSPETLGRQLGEMVPAITTIGGVSAATGGVGALPILASAVGGGALGALEAKAIDEDVASGAARGAIEMGLLHGAGRLGATAAVRAARPFIKSGAIRTGLAERSGSALGAAGAGAGSVAAQGGSPAEIQEATLMGAGLGGVMPFRRLRNPISRIKAESIARSVIAEDIKPRKRDLAYGKDPAGVIGRRGIVANSLEDLGMKVSANLKDVGQKIGRVTARSEELGRRVNLSEADTAVQKHIEQAIQGGTENQALVKRLRNLQNIIRYGKFAEDPQTGDIFPDAKSKRLLQDMSPTQAFELKQVIGGRGKWTGNPSDDAAYNAAVKDSYRAIRGGMNKSMPELTNLNKDYGDLLSARQAIENRDMIVQRNAKVGILDSMAVALGVAQHGISGGIGVFALKKALGSTAVRTRFASWLAKRTPEEIALLKEDPAMAGAIVEAIPASKGLFEDQFGRTGITPQEKAAAEVVNEPKALPAPETKYGEGFEMKESKPELEKNLPEGRDAIEYKTPRLEDKSAMAGEPLKEGEVAKGEGFEVSPYSTAKKMRLAKGVVQPEESLTVQRAREKKGLFGDNKGQAVVPGGKNNEKVPTAGWISKNGEIIDTSKSSHAEEAVDFSNNAKSLNMSKKDQSNIEKSLENASDDMDVFRHVFSKGNIRYLMSDKNTLMVQGNGIDKNVADNLIKVINHHQPKEIYFESSDGKKLFEGSVENFFNKFGIIALAAGTSLAAGSAQAREIPDEEKKDPDIKNILWAEGSNDEAGWQALLNTYDKDRRKGETLGQSMRRRSSAYRRKDKQYVLARDKKFNNYEKQVSKKMDEFLSKASSEDNWKYSFHEPRKIIKVNGVKRSETDAEFKARLDKSWGSDYDWNSRKKIGKQFYFEPKKGKK